MATTKVVKTKRVLDPLNVAYGIGAAVVIIGALFKFLNWEYANEMLFIGLGTEAIVFAISAFELRKIEKEYHWEKIFPQLTRPEETNIERLEELIEKANLDPMVVERLTNSIDQLEKNVGELTKVSDTAILAEHLARMRAASENFETEISKLNENIAEMNRYYENMLTVMGKRK